MTYPTDVPRTLVFRAQRETIALVVAAAGLTFGLSYTIHSHRPFAATGHEQQESLQDWAGNLASLTPDTSESQAIEPLTSASMVIPKSDLALPAMPMRPLVKLRGCDDANCGRPVPTPVVRRAIAATESARPVSRPRPERASLISHLNPLPHLLGMSAISKPFVYAGRTLTGWFRQF